MNVWQIQQKPIVVGMHLDGHNSAFLKTVVSLAKRLGSCIELVHSFEEPIDFLSEDQKILEDAYTSHRTTSNQLLKVMAAETSHDVDMHIHIERGFPAEDLCRIAREVSAGLIVCGKKDREKSKTFKGLSTALSLAFYAPIPVLVLSMEAEIDFGKSVNILLCDTLGGEGWLVLESALKFAKDLDANELFHTHVFKVANTDIETALHGPVGHRSGHQVNGEKDRTAQALVKAVTQRTQEELIYRFHSTSMSHEWSERYHSIVGIGDFDGEICRMIDENSCQLLMLGREQFLNKNMIAFDRIPYRTLSEQKIGLLIFPDHHLSWQSAANIPIESTGVNNVL